MNIVSLLPSATEVICHIGLRDQLVGVTHECDYPPGVADLPRVTRTHIPTDAASRDIDRLVRDELDTRQALYSLDTAVLEAVAPDLIVTQTLCDVCAVAENEVMAAAHRLPSRPHVLNLEPKTLNDVLATITEVGRAADALEAAKVALFNLNRRIHAVAERSRTIDVHPTVVLLEWADPLFSSGHWNPQIIGLAGGRELLAHAGQKSRELEWDELKAADPDVLILALCGFDIQRSRKDVAILEALPGWQELACVENRRVYVTDGAAYFSRPGPRLIDAMEMTAHLLHPTVHVACEAGPPPQPVY